MRTENSLASSNHDSGCVPYDLPEVIRSLSGSLLEVYVLDAERGAWKQVLDVLSRHAAALEIIVDDRHVDIRQFDEINFGEGSDRKMRAIVRGVEWTSTLFREDQVDLQLDPDDFADMRAMSLLLEILQEIADATGRAAVLIPETTDPENATRLASAQPSA